MVSPIVSIIVPTRNRPGMLHDALSSLQCQSFTDWECIVVDDASVVPASVPDDPRFRVIRREIALGPSGARNAGIQHAKGTYVALLDDDDAYHPDALTHLMKEARPGRIVFGRYAFLGSGETPAPQHRWEGNPGGAILSDPPPHWVGLYPRESIQWYDEDFRTGEDIEWIFRMAMTHEISTIPHVVCFHRQHPEKRPGVELTTQLSGRLRLIRKHQAWFEANPHPYSYQLARCAAAAYLAGEYQTGLRFALKSLARRPNLMGAKLSLKCLRGLLRLTTSS